MKRLFSSKKGVAALEFAIVLPLLLAILFGIVEFSLLFYDKAMVTNASREGARSGIVFRADEDGNPLPYTEAQITSVVNNYLASSLITFGGPSTASTTVVNTTTALGQPALCVTVSYAYNFFVLPKLIFPERGIDLSGLGASITLVGQTTMRLEG